MSKLAVAICGAAAAIALGGCAGDSYDHAPGYASAAGPYDVWYDGFYGPFGAGYWDGDAFFFRDRVGHFTRDDGSHFRHQRFASARKFRSSPMPNASASGANASARAPAPRPDTTRPH
jgi:hypothetical protein